MSEVKNDREAEQVKKFKPIELAKTFVSAVLGAAISFAVTFGIVTTDQAKQLDEKMSTINTKAEEVVKALENKNVSEAITKAKEIVTDTKKVFAEVKEVTTTAKNNTTEVKNVTKDSKEKTVTKSKKIETSIQKVDAKDTQKVITDTKETNTTSNTTK